MTEKTHTDGIIKNAVKYRFTRLRRQFRSLTVFISFMLPLSMTAVPALSGQEEAARAGRPYFGEIKSTFIMAGAAQLMEEEPPQHVSIEKTAEKIYVEALNAWILGDHKKAKELFGKLGDYKDSVNNITGFFIYYG